MLKVKGSGWNKVQRGTLFNLIKAGGLSSCQISLRNRCVAVTLEKFVFSFPDVQFVTLLTLYHINQVG